MKNNRNAKYDNDIIEFYKLAKKYGFLAPEDIE